jgi:hypothetical protein
MVAFCPKVHLVRWTGSAGAEDKSYRPWQGKEPEVLSDTCKLICSSDLLFILAVESFTS